MHQKYLTKEIVLKAGSRLSMKRRCAFISSRTLLLAFAMRKLTLEGGSSVTLFHILSVAWEKLVYFAIFKELKTYQWSNFLDKNLSECLEVDGFLDSTSGPDMMTLTLEIAKEVFLRWKTTFIFFSLSNM